MQHYQQGQGEVSHYPHHQARQEQGDLELEATYITVQKEAPQRILKTKNQFSVFQSHSEADIEKIISGKQPSVLFSTKLATSENFGSSYYLGPNLTMNEDDEGKTATAEEEQLKNQTEVNQIKASTELKVKSKELKSFLRIFETKNQFWVFQHLSEADIDQLIKREHPVKQSGEIFNKKICMNCGLPTRCYTYPLKCKAKKSNYSKCQKSRKYSKTKREKFKLKIRQLKQESNCQTLFEI